MVDDDKARKAILIFIVVLGVVTGLIAWNAWHRAAEPYPLAKPQPMTAEEAARYRSLRVIDDPGAKPPNVTAAEEAAERVPSYTGGVEATIEKRKEGKGEEEVPKGK